MTAITLLLVLLLGALNLANILSVRKDSMRALEIIASSEGDFHKIPPDRDELPLRMPDEKALIPQKNRKDTFLSSNFFVVRTDSEDTVIFTDVSRTSSISQEEAARLAAEVLSSETNNGKTGSYRFRVIETENQTEKTLVFLDVSDETGAYLRVLLVSACLGLICWFAMLLLVMLLADKAIRPIAENIEKQKQFITDAGHELKTPLAIILSNAEAMELIQGESKWSRNIKVQTLRLSDLMQNLLLLARMDEQQKNTPTELLQLDQLTLQTLEDFHQSLDLADIHLTTDIEDSVTWQGNRQSYVQILSILVDNAVKYTDPGGNLKITLSQTASAVVLQTENTCSSLPDVDPSKLFDRFYRGDTSRSSKTGGYGIGLAAAKSLTQNAKGSIRADYTAENRIRFTLSLPKK